MVHLVSFKWIGLIRGLINIYASVRAIQSTRHFLLDVPRSKLKYKGDQAFAVVDQKQWKKLPFHIQTAKTIEVFKFILNTLFCFSFGSG